MMKGLDLENKQIYRLFQKEAHKSYRVTFKLQEVAVAEQINKCEAARQFDVDTK